jgi:hypothetical protein
MSRKKLLLIGFIIILLIAIPITIFLVKQQQETRSHASPATKIGFNPPSTNTSPIQKNPGDTINLDVIVDPGSNLVSFVKLEIAYDPTKLATGGATEQEKAFAEDSSAMTLLEGPVYSEGKIDATLSVGVDPTKVIQETTKIATLTFHAIDGTGGTPTEVSFTSSTQVLSAGPNDQANENVLSATDVSFVTIAGEPSSTPSATVTPTETPGVNPGITLTITPTPTIPPSSTGTISATPSPTAGAGVANVAPSCTSLVADRSTVGNAPFSLTFTANGTDSDGSIGKVTFSYGDGQVDNVTTGGGIGTNTVNAATSHTYQNAGTYTASAVLTDNVGGVSSGTCSLTITVNAASGSSSGGSSATAPTEAASMPSTGPGDTLLGIGGILGILTAIGAALFFVL